MRWLLIAFTVLAPQAIWTRTAHDRATGHVYHATTQGADTWVDGVPVATGLQADDEAEPQTLRGGRAVLAYSDRHPQTNGNEYMAVGFSSTAGPGQPWAPVLWVDDGPLPWMGQSNWRPFVERWNMQTALVSYTGGWTQHAVVRPVSAHGVVGLATVIESNANPRHVMGNAVRVAPGFALATYLRHVDPRSVFVRLVRPGNGALGPEAELTQEPGHGSAREPFLGRWRRSALVWCAWSERPGAGGDEIMLAVLDRMGNVLDGPVIVNETHGGPQVFPRVGGLPGRRCAVAWEDRSSGLSRGAWRVARFRGGAIEFTTGEAVFQSGPQVSAQQPPGLSVSWDGLTVTLSKDSLAADVTMQP